MAKKEFKIALIGNPNAGKSSVFNLLTGMHQKTGNFPGVTVDKKIGILEFENNNVTIIDFPGLYSLHTSSSEELIVTNVLLDKNNPNYPDAIVYVADVTTLEKHILLFTQIKDLGFPIIFALNMIDLVDARGISYDVEKLSKILESPVVDISCRAGGHHIDKLKTTIYNVLNQFNKKKSLKKFYRLNSLEQKIVNEIKPILATDNDYNALLTIHHCEKMDMLDPEIITKIQKIKTKYSFKSLPLQVEETMNRYNTFSGQIKKGIQIQGKDENVFTRKLDNILTHKTFGPIIFFSLMFVIFQAIFSWSSYPMDLIDGLFTHIHSFVEQNFPQSTFRDLINDGIIAGIGGMVIFIPQIAILFFLVSILEEIGYMARSVFMFDKIMQKFGLSGRSIVAFISSGACAIPAIMSTRTMSDWKERLITILVSPFISCSARIPVYTLLIGLVIPSKTFFGIINLQGLVFMGLYFLGIITALLSALILKKLIKAKSNSYLLLELPNYKMPVWRNVFYHVFNKVKSFVFEAGKIIVIISIVLWFLASYGPSSKMQLAEQNAIALAQKQNLSEAETNDLIASKKLEVSYAGHIGKLMEPGIEPLGFDWKIGIALLTSFAAREVFVGTMATIYSIGSTDDEMSIRERMRTERNGKTGELTFNLASGLSLLLFYVFAMQCMATLAVVKKETGTWKWPIIQFFFMTAIAYFSSLLVYQLMS